MLIRHGARYPGSDEAETQQQVENFAKTLNQTGRATLCHNDLEVRCFELIFSLKPNLSLS